MSVYGPYLSNHTMDWIILLHLEKPHIKAVQQGLFFFFFFENWKMKAKTLKEKCEIAYIT